MPRRGIVARAETRPAGRISAMSVRPTTCYRMPGFRNTLHHGRTRGGRFPPPLGISTIHPKNRQASIRRCASAALPSGGTSLHDSVQLATRHSYEVLLPDRVFGRGLDTAQTDVANERYSWTPARRCDPISVGTGPATMPAATTRPFGASRSMNAGSWAPPTPAQDSSTSTPTADTTSAISLPSISPAGTGAQRSKSGLRRRIHIDEFRAARICRSPRRRAAGAHGVGDPAHHGPQ